MIVRGRLCFEYTWKHIGKDGNVLLVDRSWNLIPNDALDYIIGSSIKGASQYTNWYLGVFTANRTPVADDTMTTFMADCSESAAYGSASRTAITFSSPDDGVISNIAAPITLTFASAASIMGGFITTGVTIGSSTGLLLSAVKRTSPKVISEAGEKLEVTLGLALASAS